MLDWITSCASCGAELEHPCDPRDADDGANFRCYCDPCNERFYAAMAAEFPYGQCGRCGARYDRVDVECERCLGEGETIVLDGDGYQYAACGKCGGAGSYPDYIAMHEETLCGFPHGEGRWFDRPTHVEIVAALRENRDRQAAFRAQADAWHANLRTVVTALDAQGLADRIDAADAADQTPWPADDDVDDLPF